MQNTRDVVFFVFVCCVMLFSQGCLGDDNPTCKVYLRYPNGNPKLATCHYKSAPRHYTEIFNEEGVIKFGGWFLDNEMDGPVTYFYQQFPI